MKPVAGDLVTSSTATQELIQASMRDRLSYQDISFYLVELPKTPKKVREKRYRDVLIEQERKDEERRAEAMERLAKELRLSEIQYEIHMRFSNTGRRLILRREVSNSNQGLTVLSVGPALSSTSDSTAISFPLKSRRNPLYLATEHEWKDVC